MKIFTTKNISITSIFYFLSNLMNIKRTQNQYNIDMENGLFFNIFYFKIFI